MVCLPAAVVLLTALGWVLVLAVQGIQLYGSRRMAGLTCVLIGLAFWSSLFVSGVAGTIDGFVEYNSSVSGGEISTLIIGVILFFSGIGVFVFARWIERLAAGHCIRWYLRRPTTSG